MISHKHKCIYIHINKCGGTTIDTLFTGRFAGHKKALGYKRLNPSKFDNYFKFTFVRNPWDRMVSFYHYQIKRGWDYYSFDETIPFDEFVKNWLNCKDMHPKCGGTSLNTHPCYDWISDKNDKLIIDFIGKFENLQEDFDIVCGKIGIPCQKLPHRRKGSHKHYTEYYDDETREIVAKRYAKDIEYFGYEFGE